MTSLVLKMSVSLDGYVAPMDGSTDWVAAGRSDDGASWTVETLRNAGAHLMGATTYAGWAAFWPGASGPFAKPMNEIPKIVFSNSLTSASAAAPSSPAAAPYDPDRSRLPSRHLLTSLVGARTYGIPALTTSGNITPHWTLGPPLQSRWAHPRLPRRPNPALPTRTSD